MGFSMSEWCALCEALWLATTEISKHDKTRECVFFAVCPAASESTQVVSTRYGLQRQYYDAIVSYYFC